MTGCGSCSEETPLGFEVTFAFQPIVDLRPGAIFSHEALVRGVDGSGAPSVLARVDEGNRYAFDQTCRRKAIALAARLGLDTYLNINFMPNAVYRPERCIRSTLAAARQHDFPIERIMFEVSEGEQLTSTEHLVAIFREYRRLGFKTAIDDFGAGYSGLTLLADYQPDFVKLDLKLVRDVHADRNRQAIVRGIVAICRDLDVRIIAEGIEHPAESAWLHSIGIDLFQGFYFARPAFERLASVSLAEARSIEIDARYGVRARSA